MSARGMSLRSRCDQATNHSCKAPSCPADHRLTASLQHEPCQLFKLCCTRCATAQVLSRPPPLSEVLWTTSHKLGAGVPLTGAAELRAATALGTESGRSRGWSGAPAGTYTFPLGSCCHEQ